MGYQEDMTEEIRTRLDSLAATERDRPAREAANAAIAADSLGALAVQVYDESARQADLARKNDARVQGQLRREFFQRRYDEEIGQVRRLIAETLELPQDHRLLTALEWEVAEEGWDQVRFTEDDDGTIRLDRQSGQTSTLVPSFRLVTTIDGLRVSAQLTGYNDSPSLLLRHESSDGSSIGITSLVELGRLVKQQWARQEWQ